MGHSLLMIRSAMSDTQDSDSSTASSPSGASLSAVSMKLPPSGLQTPQVWF